MDWEKTVKCKKCHGSGEDFDGRLHDECRHCAGEGKHPELLHAEWSDQFDCYCVVIESAEADPEMVIAWADAIDARYNDGEDLCYVVDFQTDHRMVGPEVYTERALRGSLKHKTTG